MLPSSAAGAHSSPVCGRAGSGVAGAGAGSGAGVTAGACKVSAGTRRAAGI